MTGAREAIKTAIEVYEQGCKASRDNLVNELEWALEAEEEYYCNLPLKEMFRAQGDRSKRYQFELMLAIKEMQDPELPEKDAFFSLLELLKTEEESR